MFIYNCYNCSYVRFFASDIKSRMAEVALPTLFSNKYNIQLLSIISIASASLRLFGIFCPLTQRVSTFFAMLNHDCIRCIGNLDVTLPLCLLTGFVSRQCRGNQSVIIAPLLRKNSNCAPCAKRAH